MLRNELRRRVPEMDNRLPPMDLSLDRTVSESKCDGMTEIRDDDNRFYVHRTKNIFTTFANSSCATMANKFTENSRDIDCASSIETRKNKSFERDDGNFAITNDEQNCNTANNAFTCNCRKFENCHRITIARDVGDSRESFDSTSNRSSTNRKFANNEFKRSRCSERNVFGDYRGWWYAIAIVVVSLVSLCSGDSHQCAVGLTTPGRTWPQGDIVLEYGQSLSILCMLNMTFTKATFPGKNSSDLVFFRNKEEIQPEYIRVVNETTIEMYVEKPPPAEDMYYCKLRLGYDAHNVQDEAVCLNKVVIGFQPQEPQNFSCVSHNWENLTCSWDPVQNYVETKFILAFKLPGRAGGRKLFPCPKDVKVPLKPNTCFWDVSTDPIYRQPYESYTFFLNVANVLGNVSFPYKFHHYAHVIPAKPANLSVVNKTLDSALLHWTVPFPMQNFPPGLYHRVTYQHQWNPRKTWQVINITSGIREPKRYYNLTHLEFANSVYDVRIFSKSAVAIGEDKWSDFSDVTFRTPPRLPGMPPRTDIGSFEIAANNTNRDVYLYWQTIPPYLENGDNFKYHIALVEENGRKHYQLPNETTRTYAKFKGMSFNEMRFEVATTNVVGANPDRARITIPSRNDMPPEPLAFTKIAFDGGLYELSWKPPLNHADVTNYTIFWCDNDRDRPYQCTGYLDWVHVSRNTTIYNMSTDPTKVYQFAISANTASASSGMVWASCTVIHNKVVGKMKSVRIKNNNSTFVEVGWNLDCSERIGMVEGFNIYYCPIDSSLKGNCVEGSKRKTTIPADPDTQNGTIRGLIPYTTYSISVAVLTKNGEGSPSNPLYRTTLEGPPTTPLDVRVTNVTNTTIFVAWNRPTAMNGVLRYYEVHYNGKSQKVEETNSVVLNDLTPHRNYSISVAACTISCGPRSSAVLRTTDIGVPGKIGKIPVVRFINSSRVFVRWSPPNNPGGFLDYYQIWSATGEITNSTKTEAYIPIPDCKTVRRERMYEFRVRAINIAVDGTHLIGPWSEPGEGNCYSDGPSYRVWVIIWIISSLSGLAFVFCIAYTSKRMWLKCKAMQDVEVKLPPGLAPNMKLLQKVGDHNPRQSSTDSSGCSSGQESVTSSLTSNTHVSSDSGADVDPVHQTVNKILDPPPTWEASRLRQRNVSTARPNPTNESTRWDSYVKVAKITGEPTIDDALSLARSTPNLTDNSTGYTASPQAWSSTGYISMPSSEELSSNPSPVPEETSNTGGYSCVGVVPKSSLRSNNDGHLEIKKPIMPYVSLASLEQRSKDSKPMDSLNFDDLTFSDSKVDTLKPMVEKMSKPYVQTGFMDTTKKSYVAPNDDNDDDDDDDKTNFSKISGVTDARKSFVPTFGTTRIFGKPEDPRISKPYVAVGAINEIIAKSPGRIDVNKPKIPMVVETTSKPYVTATTGFQMLQGRDKGQIACAIDRDDDHPSAYSMCWGTTDDGLSRDPSDVDDCEKSVGTKKRATSYVTVGENPRNESQLSNPTNSGYVQHQRFEKSLPEQTSSAITDEQYSKVSVAPDANQ